MCGIIGYIGNQSVEKVLIDGLRRMEYRGYDSYGMTIVNLDKNHPDDIKHSNWWTIKTIEPLEDHEYQDTDSNMIGGFGIGHTRWATHGEPSELNAHPHIISNISIVHNGIIENYRELRKELSDYRFESDTDSEVIAALIHNYCHSKDEFLSLKEALIRTVKRLEGAYAIVAMNSSCPNEIVGAMLSSSLVIGSKPGEKFIASDVSAIVKHTKKVIHLEDNEIVELTKNSVTIENLNNEVIKRESKEIPYDISSVEKEGYKHFMLKEIVQQKDSLTDTLRGRLNPEFIKFGFARDKEVYEKVVNAKRIIIVACGTSWHAALLGKYLIEFYNDNIPVDVEYASEFRYRHAALTRDDLLIAISQSGETADTIGAIQVAQKYEICTLGISNVVGSTISRICDGGIYLHAGPEIGVASTKCFTSQIAILAMFALWRSLEGDKIHYNDIIEKPINHMHDNVFEYLKDIPKQIEDMINAITDRIIEIAHEIKDKPNMLFLGRNFNYPIALEGALKMKEISYIHAEGYPAAEIKHGPIALIDENMPVIVIATNTNDVYDKVLSNIEEVKARKGRVIVIATVDDTKVPQDSIFIPRTHLTLEPILTTIPLQLLAYHVARLRGCDIDKPRNLAKSVTVE